MNTIYDLFPIILSYGTSKQITQLKEEIFSDSCVSKHIK